MCLSFLPPRPSQWHPAFFSDWCLTQRPSASRCVSSQKVLMWEDHFIFSLIARYNYQLIIYSLRWILLKIVSKSALVRVTRWRFGLRFFFFFPAPRWSLFPLHSSYLPQLLWQLHLPLMSVCNLIKEKAGLLILKEKANIPLSSSPPGCGIYSASSCLLWEIDVL